MACACEKAKGNWKVYDTAGKVVKAYGSTDSDEIKAKAEAKRIGGRAARG